MAISEFAAALNQVATERGIPVEVVIESIEMALVSAYKRDFGATTEDITAKINRDTGEAKVYKGEEDVTPSGFGRIAAQTAKQVIMQKIRETEKEMVMADYQKKVGTIVNAHIFRMEKSVVIVDLGKAQGVMPQSEQIQSESYTLNQKIKVLIKDIREGTRGLEIIVSRADSAFVSALFATEVPEVSTGVVRIEAIAREAGSRTKIAVSSKEANVDPVGSCVGQKGVRVQSIIAELSGEKIDIIPYSPDIDRFIASSLSPAKVADVTTDKDNKEAKVMVPNDQLSLAIGKEGQNVRLAAKLTGYRIDIKGLEGDTKAEEIPAEAVAEEAPVETVVEETKDEMPEVKEEPKEEEETKDKPQDEPEPTSNE